MRRLLPLLGLVLVLTGCSADEGFATQDVSRNDYGADWPLTVDEAVLACEPGDVTTVTVNGRSYRLDDLTTDDNVAVGFQRIWAAGPVRGSHVDLSPLAKEAEALCD